MILPSLNIKLIAYSLIVLSAIGFYFYVSHLNNVIDKKSQQITNLESNIKSRDKIIADQKKYAESQLKLSLKQQERNKEIETVKTKIIYKEKPIKCLEKQFIDAFNAID